MGHLFAPALAALTITATALLATIPAAGAATLNTVGGQLIGASNVLVDGLFYDVQFVDGTCIAVFDGCDAASDFTFQSDGDAFLASHALHNQVFYDGPQGNFDSAPELTFGCGASDVCNAMTPYALNLYWYANNRDHEPDDSVAWNGFYVDNKSLSTTTDGYNVWAVWTLVPEPNTALLVTVGLVMVSLRRRRCAASR
ncbi:MAG: PEP-CTERM sorting domain-containing protein [Myxococcota bacterium]